MRGKFSHRPPSLHVFIELDRVAFQCFIGERFALRQWDELGSSHAVDIMERRYEQRGLFNGSINAMPSLQT